MKIDVAGVLIDNIGKTEAVEEIDRIIRSGKPGYVTTPYSELIVFAGKDPSYRQVLNASALSLPDGIGILWAASFLGMPASNRLTAFWQLLASLTALLFNPATATRVINERVVGSRLIWDLAELASKNNYSLSLLGGKGAVAAQTAYELKRRYPNLNVKLAMSGMPFDDKLAAEIKDSQSDILLIAYSPPQQEFWLAQNLVKLHSKVAVGLGGTFDYIARKRPPAPDFMHYMGLEWLWRLITQPWRLRRIWNAVPVFIWTVYKYKVSKL